MYPPWLKTPGFLQNKLKTPGHGVKAFLSWEPVIPLLRHPPPRLPATEGDNWLFWEDSF